MPCVNRIRVETIEINDSFIVTCFCVCVCCFVLGVVFMLDTRRKMNPPFFLERERQKKRERDTSGRNKVERTSEGQKKSEKGRKKKKVK